MDIDKTKNKDSNSQSKVVSPGVHATGWRPKKAGRPKKIGANTNGTGANTSEAENGKAKVKESSTKKESLEEPTIAPVKTPTPSKSNGTSTNGRPQANAESDAATESDSEEGDDSPAKASAYQPRGSFVRTPRWMHEDWRAQKSSSLPPSPKRMGPGSNRSFVVAKKSKPGF